MRVTRGWCPLWHHVACKSEGWLACYWHCIDGKRSASSPAWVQHFKLRTVCEWECGCVLFELFPKLLRPWWDLSYTPLPNVWDTQPWFRQLLNNHSVRETSPLDTGVDRERIYTVKRQLLKLALTEKGRGSKLKRGQLCPGGIHRSGITICDKPPAADSRSHC